MSDELIAAAELGEEARNFLASDLGKCLLGMAQQDVMDAQEQLEVIDPTKVEEIRQLQSQAKRGRNFEQWLLELLDKGESAIEVFRQQEAK